MGEGREFFPPMDKLSVKIYFLESQSQLSHPAGSKFMDVKLPKLGEGADNGVVVGIFVKEGDTIAKGQAIMELENEKAVASIPSTADGVVEKVFVKTGDRIAVGAKILSVAGGGSAPAPTAATPAVAPATKPAAKKVAAKPAPVVEDDEPVAESADEIVNENPVASPSVRKAAREFGIDLQKVHGDESGRVTGEDIKNYIARLMRAASHPATVIAAAAPGRAPQTAAA